MTQDKTTVKSKNLIFVLIKGVIIFLVVSLSLFHIFFERYSDEYLKHKKNFSSILDRRDASNIALIEDFERKITSEDLKNDYQKLITEYKELNSNVKIEISEFNKKTRSIALKDSFNGRSSFRFWLFVFGLVTALFYFACKSLFDEISKGSTFKHHLVSISGIIVACFWFVHLTLYTQSDFNKNTYFLTILGIAILFAVFTYFLVKYYTYKDQIILQLLAFISRVKHTHYKDMAKKAVFSEETGKVLNDGKTTSEAMDNFDKDLVNTVKGI